MANSRFGVAGVKYAQVTLQNGSALVTNPAVSARTLIFLSRTVGDSDKLGHLYVEYITPGTSFNIRSDKSNDNSTVNIMFAVLCASADSFYAGVMFLVSAVLLNTIVLLLRRK